MPHPDDVRLAYADTPLGQLHYAEAGRGPAVLCLHQTPRSWDEFREVLPLLATGRRVIAMDMYGFGASAKPDPGTPQTIEMYAGGAIALANALGLDRFAILGHHTGSFVACEVAASVPKRVSAAVLSAGAYADATFRARRTAHMGAARHAADDTAADVDVAPVRDDGSHLKTLWAKRAPLYPAGRPDLLNRFIRDALSPGLDPAAGHLACARYEMEERVGKVSCPVLVLANTGDPVSYPHKDRLAGALSHAASVDVVEIDGGMVPIMEQKPGDVAATVDEFLRRVGS